jgi:hypothetical protein
MFKTIHFDKEDDLFVIPTIVISKIDTKYVKATNIHIAWLRHSLVFICKKSDATPKKQEKDGEAYKPVGGYDSVTKKEKIAFVLSCFGFIMSIIALCFGCVYHWGFYVMTAFGTIAGCCALFLFVFSFAIEGEETLNSLTKKEKEN